MPPEVGWRNSVVLMDFVDTSLQGASQMTPTLVIGWSTKSKVRVARRSLVCQNYPFVASLHAERWSCDGG